MNKSAWHIAVLIPARNEEKLLRRCLDSVRVARSALPRDVSSDVVVISDCCNDQTTEIAKACLGSTGAVETSNMGNVGAARSLAAKLALQRTALGHERVWLANTDADCEVPADWLTRQLARASEDFAAVAGIIDVDSFEEHDPRVRDLFRQTYLIGEDGTHPHVHGANLGVRADVYLKVGGWFDLKTAEDHDLWKRLHRSGFQKLSDASLQVITSGRRVGRAPSGFAGALAAHNGALA